MYIMCILIDSNFLFYSTIAFSLGHRKCPGQSMAQTKMFIFISNLLLHFNFEAAADLPSDDPRTFILETGLTPPRFNMRMIHRYRPTLSGWLHKCLVGHLLQYMLWLFVMFFVLIFLGSWTSKRFVTTTGVVRLVNQIHKI